MAAATRTRSMTLLLLASLVGSAGAAAQSHAAAGDYAGAGDSTTEADRIVLPDGYASDAWLQHGTGSWDDERQRREDQLYDFLEDDDLANAKAYGFKAELGHSPTLAWDWFDQHPVGYGGVPYVLLQTILSLDPVKEKDDHLRALAKIWKKPSVIADELGSKTYTLDHLGFGPHPTDYDENGVASPPDQRDHLLPNGFVYDPEVEPESVWFVDWRLKMMRDGFIGSLIKSLNPDYQPKIAQLLVLARGKMLNKLYGGEIDYEHEVDRLQEAPPVDAVFFSCSGCHQGRVIVGGEMDDVGNIVKAGEMKFLPGMPNTEIEAQYFSKLLMESGLALIESGFSANSTQLPRTADEVKPSTKAILALYTRMLDRAIDPEQVKTIYGSSDEQIKRAKLQTHAAAREFPKYVGDLIGVAIKTQFIYYQIAEKYAFNPDNPNKAPGQPMPDVIGDRVGQMDAFGIASGLVDIHTRRKDNSYLKFMQQDNPDNPLLAGIDTMSGFSCREGVEDAGRRIRNNLRAWAPPVPAPIDVKSLNWSGHRALANWDGNQGASARTLASGVSATGDPLKVNVRIHEPLNALINHMPPPPYPFAIDRDKARRGMEIFNGVEGSGMPKGDRCSNCHKPNSKVIFPASALGVDANRSMVNTDVSRYGLATLVMEACDIFMRKYPDNDWCLPRDENGEVIDTRYGDGHVNPVAWAESNDDYFKDTPERVRHGMNGYKADMLHGIWARAPYLHNGSVPTLMHMLCPDTRPTVFKRGVVFYDEEMVGFEWAVTPRQRYSTYDVMQVKEYNTEEFGRTNQGHTYGSSLCPDTSDLDPREDREEITRRVAQSEVGDLLEYLKTL